MSSELILHHYPLSPFSEKIRLVFGAKKLAWRSVHIPVLMPKPDVIALTGGYRKTPLLQIGADIYCDTTLICEILDRLAPAAPLLPAGAEGEAALLAQWADTTLFWTAVPYTLQPEGMATIFADAPPEVLDAFMKDRLAFAPHLRHASGPDATACLRSYLAWLESMFGDGRTHLLRAGLSLADFSVAQCLWFVKHAPSLAAIFEDYPGVHAWLARMLAIGHGQETMMESADAVAHAAASARHAPVQVLPGMGHVAGEVVTVRATDYGVDPATGTLVGMTNDSVTVARQDPRAGTLHVHFPRRGFRVTRGAQD